MVCEASCAMDNRNKDMTERQENNNEKRSMPLERGNFTGMAIAGAMIVLGFVQSRYFQYQAHNCRAYHRLYWICAHGNRNNHRSRKTPLEP